MNIQQLLSTLQKQHIKSPAMSLAHTRENVLFGIILTISIIGFIAYIPSFIGAIHIGYIDTAVIDTLFYFWSIFLLFCKNITFTQRTLGLLIPIWLLSIYLIIRFGITGAGFLWLFVAPIFAGMLLGLKEGFYSLFLTLIALLLLGLLINRFDIFVSVFGKPPLLAWSIMSGNTFVLGTLIMVSTSVMIRGLNQALRQLERKIKEIALTEDATIETVASLAEYRDIDTGEHIKRTKKYVRIIAEHLSQHAKYQAKLTPEYIELLYKSASLHDIGKIGVPDSILLKPGKLTTDEYEIMKKHTIYGRDALLSSERKLGHNSFLHLAAEIAYTHQERWNGSGYPIGLKGEDIPLSGRIMAVADVYDALTNKRVYKEALSHVQAIDFLKQNSGVLFDPEIIDLLPDFENKFYRVHQKHKE